MEKGDDPSSLIEEYNINPNKNFFPIKFEEKWWLERIFHNKGLSFMSGLFILYLIVEIPRFAILPVILESGSWDIQAAYFSTYLGDLVLILSLILLKVVFDSQKKLCDHLNNTLNTRFTAPLSLIKKEAIIEENKFEKKERSFKENYLDPLLEKIDRSFKENYLNPLMGKILQKGFDLSFNVKYQLGCGAIAAAIFLTIILLRYVFFLLPESVFSFWIPIEALVSYWTAYSIFFIALLWFVVGMLAWTLFVVFLTIIQICGTAISIRPFEALKDFFQPITSLALRLSFAITVIVSWFSPYMLVWTYFPSDPIQRQGATNFIIAVLFATIPIIILSLAIPIVKMHKGLNESRDKALYLKNLQLKQLQNHPIKNKNKHLQIENHLIEDYKNIQQKSEWALSSTQLIAVIGNIMLPIITFILS
jgi:hypothetical protein